MSQSSISSVSNLAVITLSVIPQAPSATKSASITTVPIPLAVMTSTASSRPAVATQSADVAAKSNSPNNTPIIVGIVCGVVGASIVTTLVWLCLRRRKYKSMGRHSEPRYDGKDGKEYSHVRQHSDCEGTHLKPGDGRGKK